MAVFKVLGGVYLLWLAYRALRTALTPNPSSDVPMTPAVPQSLGRYYMRGLGLHITNPQGNAGLVHDHLSGHAQGRPRIRRGARGGRMWLRMADDLPLPEPKEIDEKLSLQLKHLAQDAVLRGRPNGEERCDNCLFYLEPDTKISYCWHPKLRVLVGDNWWEALPQQ